MSLLIRIQTAKQKKKQKHSLIRSIASQAAKITLKFNINYHIFIEYYKSYLVKHTKKENPDFSLVELSCRTGIDRRYIKKYLYIESSIIKQSKPKLVLNELKKLCYQANLKNIKKTGPFQSFDSICNSVAPGSLTTSAIAKELLRQGSIIDKGNKFELVKYQYIPNTDDEIQQFRILTTELNRLTNTVIYNFEQSDHTNKQFQRNVFSTQINPQNFNLIKHECTQVLNDAKEKVENILLQYEENISPDTYPAFGASFFLFGYENHQSKSNTKA